MTRERLVRNSRAFMAGRERPAQVRPTLVVNDKTITPDGACYIIAEIGHNHGGSIDVALDMIDAAADCGVDAVKFQKRDNRTLFTKEMYSSEYNSKNAYGRTYGEHRECLELGRAQYERLIERARERGVDFMCTPFDPPSVDFLAALDTPAYKIASFDLTNLPLIEYTAQLGRPIFLSTGASTMAEIRQAYELIERYGVPACLMHCVSRYPTPESEVNLGVVSLLAREFPNAVIGYSGHDAGVLAGVAAYAMGAVVLEKHFTLDRQARGSDHHFSLDPDGMRRQVQQIRAIETMRGTGVKRLREEEMPARTKLGKGVYAARKLANGTILSMSDLVIKSPGHGLTPNCISQILGRRLVKDLSEEEPIQLSDVA